MLLKKAHPLHGPHGITQIFNNIRLIEAYQQHCHTNVQHIADLDTQVYAMILGERKTRACCSSSKSNPAS